METMNDLGFEQLGPIGGGTDFEIVFFYDPESLHPYHSGTPIITT